MGRWLAVDPDGLLRSLAADRRGLLERHFVRRDFGFADKGRTFLDDQTRRLQVALKHRTGLQLAALFDGYVSVDLAVHGGRLRFDLAADLRILADGQNAGGGDFTFDFSINDEVVEELDGSFDFNVCGENVFRTGIGDVGHD